MTLTPELIALILGYALKYGPALAMQISTILQKKEVTFADLDALLFKINTSYEEFVKPKVV